MKHHLSGQGKFQTVIWDWNGTLLDDVEVNRKIINLFLLFFYSSPSNIVNQPSPLH